MIFRRTSRNILLDHTDSKVTAEFAQNDHAEEVFYRQLKQTGLKLACDERMNIIPAGTLLCFPLGAGNLDQATFGDDANIFNPDRYKNKSLLNKFFLFNWGKRACSGAPLARIEYPLIIGGILKRFNLELANRSEPDITCSITRMFSDGLEVVIKER